jgi:hypothetical protein
MLMLVIGSFTPHYQQQSAQEHKDFSYALVTDHTQTTSLCMVDKHAACNLGTFGLTGTELVLEFRYQ